MNLRAFREKYPQYKDWPDQRLKNAIERKHASEGIPEEEKGWSGVARDVGKSFNNLYPSAVGLVKELIPQAKSSGKQIFTDPSRAIANVGAGFGEGVIGALNIPSNIAGYLQRKDIISPETNKMMQKMHIGDTGFEKAIGLGDEQQGDALLRGIGSFMPYSRIGRAAEGLRGLGSRGGAAAAWGAGQNQDPLQAAMLGMIAERGVHGVGQIPNLVPSRFLRENLNPEQLQANLRATEGTETGLGDVIGNPKLKQFIENQAASFPYSGADQAMQRTANEIQARSNSAVENLLEGHHPEDIGQALVDVLSQASEEANQIKNQNWERVNQLADENGVDTSRPALRSAARSALSRIDSDPDLSALRGREDRGLLSNIAQVNSGNSRQAFSLRNTDLLRGELGERAYQAYVDNDKPKYNLYRDLQRAVEADLRNAVERSGSQELRDARNEAMRFHREEFAPFEDPDIMRFTRRNADPDTVVQYFLRTGRLTDRSNLLRKLQSKLPEDQQGLLPYAYFSNAVNNGNVNPNTLRTLYNNLGERQRDVLFSNRSHRQDFNDLSSLIGMNQEALNLMSNPKTGWKIGNALQNALQLATAAIAGAHGGLPAAIAGGAAAHFIPGVAMRPFVSLLTNPSFRENLVNRMLEREPRRNLQREQLIQSLIDRTARGGRAVHVPLSGYLNENPQAGSA